MAFGRLSESRGGAPRGERPPPYPPPLAGEGREGAASAPAHIQVATLVCVAQTMVGAPVGAPPPLFMVEAKNQTKLGRECVARTNLLILPRESGGRGTAEGGGGGVRPHSLRKRLGRCPYRLASLATSPASGGGQEADRARRGNDLRKAEAVIRRFAAIEWRIMLR